MLRHLLIILALLCFLLAAAPLAAEEENRVSMVIDGSSPITITADSIEASQDNAQAIFSGRVLLTRGEESITAEKAIWDNATKSAEISGNVNLVTPDFTALAQRAVVNIDLQLAKIYNGRAFFPARHYYISGDLIERQGPNTVYVKKGRATTCDGPEPSWSIVAEDLTITAGGYAHGSGVTFDTKYFPAFYVPYFLFPVKNERQTGLLLPSATSSSRDGLTIGLPFFWAIDENYDLTYTPVWREKRGLSSTLEGRYHLESGRGIWQGTFLNDNDPGTFSYRNGIQDTAEERYWLRSQNNWQINGWDINLDLDLVSDPLYLNTFKSDLDGFYYSQNLFSAEFGRSLNEYLDPLRTSTLFAQKNEGKHYFRGTVEYTDDLYSHHNNDTLQKMPSLYYALIGQQLPLPAGTSSDGTVPRFNLEARYDYFYRAHNQQSLTNETGQRFLLSPDVNWSFDLNGVASLNLSGDLALGLYAPTGYRPSAYGPDAPQARHDNFEHRLDGSFSAALSTTFSKIYEGGPGDSLATRHQISPTVSFTLSEAGDQDELPYWDLLDRRLKRRTLRYGLLNTFTSKAASTDELGQADYEYFQFLKIGLWSGYELANNLKWSNDPYARYYVEGYFDRGANPFELELEANYNPYVGIRLLSTMNGRTGEFISHDINLKLTNKRGDLFYLTYDFDNPASAVGTQGYQAYEEIRSGVRVRLASDWSASFSTRYDLDGNKRLETYASLNYQAQCYGLSILYSDSENDRRVGLAIDLLGLGQVSSGNQDNNSLDPR